MLNLRQIEAFRAIMIAGSMTGAASHLRISQPALSRMLRRIEDVLRTPLFERGTGRLVATREAHDIFAEIQKVYAQMEGLSGAVMRIVQGQTGTFHCGASPGLGRRIVPRALARVHAAYPALELKLDILSLAQVNDLKEIGEIEQLLNTENGLTYVYLKGYKSIEDAKAAVVKAEGKGVLKPFVVGFKDGKKVDLKEMNK
jgi:DNA-binding transcriptional LysR family regulator